MVLAAARVVGERHGLDERWLDLAAAQFVPRGDDIRAKTIHNSPGLVVTGASAEHRLAMKVFAGRRPDLNDIKHLAGILGITRTSDAIRIYNGRTLSWLVMERTRRNVGDEIAEAREERGEPVPELTLESNTTLCAEGGGSRRYEVMAAERADGRETPRVTVRDPQGPDHDEQRPVRRVDDAPGPFRTLEGANAAVSAYQRRARTRDRMAPMETPGRAQAGRGTESRGRARPPLRRQVDSERRDRRPARPEHYRPVKRRRGAERPRGCCSGRLATASCAASSRRTRSSTATSRRPPVRTDQAGDEPKTGVVAGAWNENARARVGKNRWRHCRRRHACADRSLGAGKYAGANENPAATPERKVAAARRPKGTRT